METTNSIKESEFNIKPFKITYIISFAVILIFDIIITVLLFTIWVNLEVTIFFRDGIIGLLFYYLIPFSPIVKVGFEIFELIRFSRFLNSGNQDKKNALNVAKGFKGTRIYRIYYLVLIASFILWTEILEYSYKTSIVVDPNPTAFLRFSWWFAILLFIHILPLILGPEIIKFSIDYRNKKNKINMILKIVLWTIILILVLNLDFFILLVSLIISKT